MSLFDSLGQNIILKLPELNEYLLHATRGTRNFCKYDWHSNLLNINHSFDYITISQSCKNMDTHFLKKIWTFQLVTKVIIFGMKKHSIMLNNDKVDIKMDINK